MISGRSVLMFGGSDWWLHNRITEHHFALELARAGNRVVFVNSIGVGIAPPTSAAVWRRIGRKLTSYLRWLRRVEDGLWVASPFTLPFWTVGWVRRLNEWLLAAQVRLVMRIAGMEQPVIVSSIPTACVVIDRLPHRGTLYFLKDNFSDYYEDMAFSLIREHDAAMRRDSDVVVCASIGFQRELEAERPDVYWVPHGVNRVFLEASSAVPAGKGSADAPDAARAPRIVYWGQLDVGVDGELLDAIAAARPDWEIDLIGPVIHDFGELERRPNVRFTGRMKPAELVAAARRADVLIMPWKESRWIEYCCPIKFREYLAIGKPIVSVPIIDVAESYGDVARIASGVDEWLAALEEAIAEKDPEREQRRRACVAGYDIRAAAERFSSAIERALEVGETRGGGRSPGSRIRTGSR